MSTIRELLTASVSVYPNPTNDLLRISGSIELENVSIFNVTGQKIMEADLNGLLQKNIDISSLKQGMYIIRVKSISDELYSTRVVKQ